MPRRTFVIIDPTGTRLGTLKALREEWAPGEQLVVRGRPYQLAAVVELEEPDRSGATALLIVADPPATAA